MPIENNLPVILDTATQTEDGLMSWQDKTKLDNIDQSLSNAVKVTDKIKSSQLDISSESSKIQLNNLSSEVIQAIAGTASVNATVAYNGITTEKLADNAVTINKIDKRTILGNIVSPRPLNFTFGTETLVINIPKGSLLLTDAVTTKNLVTGVDLNDVTLNINYPSNFDGLNYIVSLANNTIEMINYRQASSISNTSTIIALVSLSSTYQANIIINGNYTINGKAQGLGTESAALMGTGKIIFDQRTGIIDFTNVDVLYLVIGGVYNRTINAQSSVRITGYSSDSIYCLYWDNGTSSLKTALTTSITDTDINKIAIIQNGRIVPYVNTGIFYSKPHIDAYYYTEKFECIENIGVISSVPINILTESVNKLQIADGTYVYINEDSIKVKNTECYYLNRDGLHFILFDLDTSNISCRHNTEDIDTSKKTIVIGTMWVSDGKLPQVSGNLKYTVNGKSEYKDDLTNAEESIVQIKEILLPDSTDNKILSGNELYMINDEELPIYSSSMLITPSEGLAPAIAYNKNDSIMSPRTEFFNGNILLNPSKVGSNMTLLAADKYTSQGYLKKSVSINKVASTAKSGQTVKVLCLGDELIADKTVYYVSEKLKSLGVDVKMLGSMINSAVYGEGRKGWFYSTFVGASGRGYEEGAIVPQGSQGVSSILLNPFIHIADANDKANNPTSCYRASGSYSEKSYATDNDKSGAFYIFNFSKYMEVQGIETPDVVVIAIKPELCNVYTEDIVNTNMIYLKQLVQGIRLACPNAYIALIPQYGSSTLYSDMWKTTSKMVEETNRYIETLSDNKVKVISSWLHMSREFGTDGFITNANNTQLHKKISTPLNNKLSETAKIELSNSISAFIMNI